MEVQYILSVKKEAKLLAREITKVEEFGKGEEDLRCMSLLQFA